MACKPVLGTWYFTVTSIHLYLSNLVVVRNSVNPSIKIVLPESIRLNLSWPIQGADWQACKQTKTKRIILADINIIIDL